MTPLADACAELAAWLPAAEALIAEPDIQPAIGRAQPSSKPPWNAAAATALLDALEGARQLEALWRSDAAGRLVTVRPMSATGQTLASLVRLSYGLPDCPPAEYDEQNRPLPCRCQRCSAVWNITRWTTVILQLPAVDEIEPPKRPPVPCPRPRCGRRMLRWWPRDKSIACLGCLLKASVTEGQLSGEPMLVWEDGLVQVAPILDPESMLVT